MRPRTRFSRAGMAVLAAVTTVVAVVGCGSDADEAAQPEEAGPAAETPSEEPEPEAPSPTPGPTPEFSALAPEDAADGTDVGACADGACEVAVTAGTTIPFDPGVGGVTIAEVGESRVRLAIAFSGGGSGFTEVGIGPEGGSFGNADTMIVEFAVLGIEDGTAVMRFAPEGS
ncbi:hypothetical protein RM780_27415 [Streptomyces sp. DSM 44917]|uniref:Lipoprotein n=1 Tax=Streptomyces boetiae TaxID=3075541 RepID=A0ABU2LGD5_9ACTN|nr:hypothetical protein [Streptomyces sp. DSM 44917]MDT0310645.1 hypothetical protein [Streptomyces sp. DSM 44917]